MTSSEPIFVVADSVFAHRPDYIVGCVLARNVNNKSPNNLTSKLLEDAIFRAQATYEGADLKQTPEIAAWREAFSRQGWSGSKYPSSVEAIVKRVTKGRGVPNISPVVDIANASVLYYSVPIGTHDLDTLTDGPLTVRAAGSDDRFLQMGGNTEESLPSGEIIYVTGNDVRTRRWVWRQSQTALIGTETTNIFYPIDGFSGTTCSNVEAAMTFIAETCREVLGADVSSGLVTIDNQAFIG